MEPGESALEAGLREASEEVGRIPEPIAFLGDYVFAPALDWKYVTSVVQVREQFGSSVNFETDEVAWFEPSVVGSLDLHSGFAAAWPSLRLIVDQAERKRT